MAPACLAPARAGRAGSPRQDGAGLGAGAPKGYLMVTVLVADGAAFAPVLAKATTVTR